MSQAKLLPNCQQNAPFNEYNIQRRKPLRVKAKGMININKTKADVDSSSSSTMPTAYRTLYVTFSKLQGNQTIHAYLQKGNVLRRAIDISALYAQEILGQH
jgi:hypothetical protein